MIPWRKRLARWVISDVAEPGLSEPEGVEEHHPEWDRLIPFVAMHLACVGVIWVGWSPVAVSVAVALYFIRMFAITAFYHRYFSHRTFKTSRFTQFVFAAIGNGLCSGSRAGIGDGRSL